MDKKELGLVLRAKRKCTVSEFSRLSGLERYQIRAIELGLSNYTIDSLLMYCNACGVKPMFLSV